MNRDAGSKNNPGQAPAPDTVPPGDEHPDQPHPEYAINIYRDWCKGLRHLRRLLPPAVYRPGRKRRAGG